MSPWERRDYVARSYGQGRIFIAGDAAHECSPTGGIGMHTGLEEAVNLGWKLAALTEGWGGPALLASYEIERRPIAVRNVGLATRTYNAIAAIPGWREGVTDWKANPAWLSIPEHMKLALRLRRLADLRAGRHAAAWPMDPTQFVPSTRPGTRAPHAWLDDERSTLDLFGDGFVLLRLGANPPDATRPDRCGQGAGRADARGHPRRSRHRRALRDEPGAGAAGRPRRLARQRMPGRCRAPSLTASAAPPASERSMSDRPREAHAQRAHLL